MAKPYIRNWRWNRGMNTLVAEVEILGEPGLTEVHIPIERVSMDYAEILGDLGYDRVSCAEVGSMASVDGFLSKVRRIAKRAVKGVKKQVTTGIPYEPKFVATARRKIMGRRLSALHDKYRGKVHAAVTRSQQIAKRYGKKAARSKALGAALGGAALAFPAVGAPALAAWTAANRYVTYADQAKRALQLARAGGRVTPQNRARIQRGRQVLQGLQRVRTMQHDPRARMLMGAMKSLPARRPTWY